jgi:hypothetical protein
LIEVNHGENKMIQAQEQQEQQQWLVFEKLQKARIMLQSAELKKSGHNKFAGYKYFELGDFLPAVNQIFADLKLCQTLEFSQEMAVMWVIDTENGGMAKFTCPMASAHLKGCHEVQNLGASITYITRYLLVMALAICEHDAIDASEPVAPASAKSIAVDVFSKLSEEEQNEIRTYGVDVISLLSKNDIEGAVEYIKMLDFDADTKTAFWSLLDSKQKAAIKKFTTR